MKHYKEKLADLLRCFAEGTYAGERFGAGYLARLTAYERTDNCRTDLARVIALVRPQPGLRVLDYGCGTGVLCGELAAAGCAVTGADAISEVLALARQRHPDVPFVGISDAAGEYDVIVSMHVLGHVPDARQALAKMRSLLRPGGRLVFCVPNPAFTIAMIPNNMVNDYLPDPTVMRCWPRRRLISEFTLAGFSNITIETFGEFPAIFRFDALRSRLVGEASKC